MKKALFICAISFIIISLMGCSQDQQEVTDLEADSKIYLLTKEELDKNAEIIEDTKKDINQLPKEDKETVLNRGFKEGYEQLFSILSEDEKDIFSLGISISRYSVSGVKDVFREQENQALAFEGQVKNGFKLKNLPSPNIGDSSFAYVLVKQDRVQLSQQEIEDIFGESYINTLSEEELMDLFKEKLYTIGFTKNNIWVEVTTMKYSYGIEDSVRYAKIIEKKIR